MNQNITSNEKAASGNCVFISFCNQISSPNYSLCILDSETGDAQWISLLDLPSELRQDFSGITGICYVDKGVVIATQSATPTLIYLNNEQKITNYIALQQCRDTHSLTFHNGYIYIVSTGTNEIYRVSFFDGNFVKEELFWQYPDVKYDKDEVHLNGLTIDKDCLIASCFGNKKVDGSWDVEGRIFYVDSNQTIHGGLNQPHSPVIDGERLVFAESKAQKIYLYNKSIKDEWYFEKDFVLNGYTRGLILKENRIWVAISADRKSSRSKKTFEASELESGDSAIVEIDINTCQKVTMLNLIGFGREVYDLTVTSMQTTLLPILDVVYVRLREFELLGNKLRQEKQTLYQQYQSLQADRQQLQDEHQQLKDEIIHIYQTGSWRITAPARCLVRLWLRLRSKLLAG